MFKAEYISFLESTYTSTYNPVLFVRTTQQIIQKIWWAIIRINIEGKFLIMKFGPGLLFTLHMYLFEPLINTHAFH